MGLVRNFFSIVLGVMLMTACSNSDSNDWESGDSNWDFEFLEDAESGYLDGFGQKIPIILIGYVLPQKVGAKQRSFLQESGYCKANGTMRPSIILIMI